MKNLTCFARPCAGLLALGLGFTSCEEAPVAETPLELSAIERVELRDASGEVALTLELSPQETAQLTAVVVYDDGMEAVVTGDGEWFTADPSVVTVSEETPGLILAQSLETQEATTSIYVIYEQYSSQPISVTVVASAFQAPTHD
jgi:hypothetical protein